MIGQILAPPVRQEMISRDQTLEYECGRRGSVALPYDIVVRIQHSRHHGKLTKFCDITGSQSRMLGQLPDH